MVPMTTLGTNLFSSTDQMFKADKYIKTSTSHFVISFLDRQIDFSFTMRPQEYHTFAVRLQNEELAAQWAQLSCPCSQKIWSDRIPREPPRLETSGKSQDSFIYQTQSKTD